MSEVPPRLEHTFDLVGVSSLVAEGALQSMSSPDTYGAGEARQKQKDRLERARSVLGAVEARHVMRSVSGHDLDKEARNLRAHGVYHVKPTVQEMLGSGGDSGPRRLGGRRCGARYRLGGCTKTWD